jgi:peptide/nickel transport system substrate-binding protein
VRGFDPPNFDHHLTLAGFTQSTVGFVYSKLVRHKVRADVPPGTFIIEPDLAERWEELDDMTYVFHLRQGVKWHNKPPLNGRELVAEDVKFTYDRFLSEPGNTNRYLLDSVDRLQVVDRHTVKVPPQRALCLAGCAGVPVEHVDHRPGSGAALWRPEEGRKRHWHRPFLLERYQPNVKTVFKRNPDYYREASPMWMPSSG